MTWNEVSFAADFGKMVEKSNILAVIEESSRA